MSTSLHLEKEHTFVLLFDINLSTFTKHYAENDNALRFNFIGEFCCRNNAHVNDANSASDGMLDNQYYIACDALSADLAALLYLPLLPSPKLSQLFGNYNTAL